MDWMEAGNRNGWEWEGASNLTANPTATAQTIGGLYEDGARMSGIARC